MHACFPVGLREELDAGLTLYTESGDKQKKIRRGQKRAMRGGIRERGRGKAWSGRTGVWEGPLTPVEAIEQPYKKLMER